MDQAIQQSSRMKTIAGENDPRLRPIDLPDDAYRYSLRYPDRTENYAIPRSQNKTTLGRASAGSDLDIDVTREEAYDLAKKVYMQEYLYRKGVDVDGESKYLDGPTDRANETLLKSSKATKEKLKAWERYMNDRANNGVIDEANPEFKNPRGSGA